MKIKLGDRKLLEGKILGWACIAFIMGWPLFFLLWIIGEQFTYFCTAVIGLSLLIYVLLKASVSDIIGYTLGIITTVIEGILTTPMVILPFFLMLFMLAYGKYSPRMKRYHNQAYIHHSIAANHPLNKPITKTQQTNTSTQSGCVYVLICFIWLQFIILFGGTIFFYLFINEDLTQVWGLFIIIPLFIGSCYGFWWFFKKISFNKKIKTNQ
ncbi:hypothetical protein [Neisseria sp. Ec49-e6-T10]|uniref:hypothetical protein n=1 Tax=Neisseria sp. Ec49-e6-T10 TaxID=3140744 RepID=UPI003EBE9565